MFLLNYDKSAAFFVMCFFLCAFEAMFVSGNYFVYSVQFIYQTSH